MPRQQSRQQQSQSQQQQRSRSKSPWILLCFAAGVLTSIILLHRTAHNVIQPQSMGEPLSFLGPSIAAATAAATNSNDNNSNLNRGLWGQQLPPPYPQTNGMAAVSVSPPPMLPPRPLSPNERNIDAYRWPLFGGLGDPVHLGGFLDYDESGVSPAVWKHMVQILGIRSIVDVGCGRGIATSWFQWHNLSNVVCVEGSRDAQLHTLVLNDAQLLQVQQRGTQPSNTGSSNPYSDNFVLHDYTRGPWWPTETYDAVWASEFVGHVSRQYLPNYMATFQQAALIFITAGHARHHTGWHSVEQHSHGWWKQRMELQGFAYAADLTDQLRQLARDERQANVPGPIDGSPFKARHIWLDLLVFVNPQIARRPQHQHLLPEDGCRAKERAAGSGDKFQSFGRHASVPRACGDSPIETALPASWAPPIMTHAMDQAWLAHVKASLGKVQQAHRKQRKAETFKSSQQTNLGGNGTTTSDGDVDGAIDPSETAGDESSIPMVPLLKRIEAGGKDDLEDLPKLSIAVWPMIEVGLKTAEHRHVFYDGLKQSPHFEMIDGGDRHNDDNGDDEDPLMSLKDPDNTVWVGDIACCDRWFIWCEKFAAKIRTAKALRKSRNLPTAWPIFIVDFSDGVQLPHCPQVDKEVGAQNVRYSSRSLVRRQWSDTLQWTRSATPKRLTDVKGHDYRHTPLIARTDTVAALEEGLKERGLTLASPIERATERPVDVAHYWPLEAIRVVNHDRGNLRGRVSAILDQLRNETGITAFLGIKGKAASKGRRNVHSAYVDGLLESKIVVVSQRDSWEDHYRLMEALLGGAMVMTDRIVAKPDGLVNGTSIVEFDSAESLRSLVLYYLKHNEERLQIAQAGRLAAMSRHRSWHRLETIIFGRPLTCTNSTSGNSACPYVTSVPEA